MEKTALIIDDDALVRHLLGSMLESLGYAVSTLESGAETRALFASNPPSPQIIFIDLFLGDATGAELFEFLRPQSSAKIGIISANPREEIIEMLNGNEADFYLEKPFKAQDIAATIDSLFSH